MRNRRICVICAELFHSLTVAAFLAGCNVYDSQFPVGSYQPEDNGGIVPQTETDASDGVYASDPVNSGSQVNATEKAASSATARTTDASAKVVPARLDGATADVNGNDEREAPSANGGDAEVTESGGSYIDKTSDAGAKTDNVTYPHRRRPSTTPSDGGRQNADTDGDGDPDATDCDETNPAVYHGANEVCDKLDNNCDGRIDERCPPTDTTVNTPTVDLLDLVAYAAQFLLSDDVLLNCGVSIYNTDTDTFTNWCGQPQPEVFVVSQEDGSPAVVMPFASLTIEKGSTLMIQGEKPVVLAALNEVTIRGTLVGNASYINQLGSLTQ